MFDSFKLFDSFKIQIHFEMTKPPEHEMKPLEQVKGSNNELVLSHDEGNDSNLPERSSAPGNPSQFYGLWQLHLRLIVPDTGVPDPKNLLNDDFKR